MIGQYANSPVLVSLDNGLKELFNDSPVVVNWYNALFNMNTATGYGLDIWGKILNRSRGFIYNGTEYYLQGEQTIGGVHFSEEEMELLGHSLYVFLEAKSNTVQVLYKRNDGDLGLIEPQI